MKKPAEEQKFEHVIRELEAIVNELDGSLDLETSLQKFKRGMELAELAEKRLHLLENQFHKIQREFTAQGDTGSGDTAGPSAEDDDPSPLATQRE